jgi:hypothetical protein
MRPPDWYEASRSDAWAAMMEAIQHDEWLERVAQEQDADDAFTFTDIGDTFPDTVHSTERLPLP